MKRKKEGLIPLTHPGEILLEEFLKPLELSLTQVAKDLSIPLSRLSEITHGKRRITVDTAIRLSKYFKNSESFWLNLQNNYDLQELLQSKKKAFSKIKAFVRKKQILSHL